jgi:hypothetical protein
MLNIRDGAEVIGAGANIALWLQLQQNDAALAPQHQNLQYREVCIRPCKSILNKRKIAIRTKLLHIITMQNSVVQKFPIMSTKFCLNIVFERHLLLDISQTRP